MTMVIRCLLSAIGFKGNITDSQLWDILQNFVSSCPVLQVLYYNEVADAVSLSCGRRWLQGHKAHVWVCFAEGINMKVVTSWCLEVWLHKLLIVTEETQTFPSISWNSPSLNSQATQKLITPVSWGRQIREILFSHPFTLAKSNKPSSEYRYLPCLVLLSLDTRVWIWHSNSITILESVIHGGVML